MCIVIVLTRERPVVRKNLTAVTYRNTIALKQMCDNYQPNAVTLSLSKDGSQLIVGLLGQRGISICNGTNFTFVTPLLFPTFDGLFDAVWTPDGNIVYTTAIYADFGTFSKVVTMSQKGDVIALTNMTNAAQLSVSASKVVYLADGTKGVYQSSDGGLTWSLMFNLTDGVIENSNRLLATGWYIWQALEVSKDQNFVRMWTVEVAASTSYKRFRIYTLFSNNNATEITETVHVNTSIALLIRSTSSAEFDGLETVLLSCCSEDVYLFNSTSGAYLRSIRIATAFANRDPERLAIDRHADGQVLLYIFHVKNCSVSIQTLSYD
jgi:hypothetical protein